MPKFRWNSLKSKRLEKTRGVSFEELTQHEYVALIDHPTRSHQIMFLFHYKRQIWVVPAVKEEDGVFLKTLYPSRKLTKQYNEGKI